MNPVAHLTLDIQAFWHPGTGRGDGLGADAVVHRGADGLPVLPGRTVKGLVRHAVRLGRLAKVGSLNLDVETHLFGTGLDAIDADDRVRALEEARFATRPGALHFQDARLGATPAEQTAWRAFATSPAGKEAVVELCSLLSSTALEDGVAKDGSLRTIEAWVPMTLHTWVEYSPTPGAPRWRWEDLDLCARAFLRAVGSHRTRGLGRCAATLVEEKK
jgi:hypothetical protein